MQGNATKGSFPGIRRRKYPKLRTRAFELDYTQDDLAGICGKSRTYISRRFSGIEPWSTDDMAILGPALNIPFADWLLYFVDEPEKYS